MRRLPGSDLGSDLGPALGRILPPVLVLLAALALAVLPDRDVRAQSQDLIVDLSQHLVAITTGFTGADVLLFGAAESGDEVVVIVRGPPVRTAVRRKERIAGIWINKERMVFPRAPSFFHVAASGDLAGQPIDGLLREYELGAEYTELSPRESDKSSPYVEAFREALIRNKENADLYAMQSWPVTFIGKRLFRTTVPFPANVPTGTYQIEVHSLREGKVIETVTTPLVVSKAGFGAALYDFAHQYSAAYGLVAIVTAAMAGWAAGSLFRKT